MIGGIVAGAVVIAVVLFFLLRNSAYFAGDHVPLITGM